MGIRISVRLLLAKRSNPAQNMTDTPHSENQISVDAGYLFFYADMLVHTDEM